MSAIRDGDGTGAESSWEGVIEQSRGQRGGVWESGESGKVLDNEIDLGALPNKFF